MDVFSFLHVKHTLLLLAVHTMSLIVNVSIILSALYKFPVVLVSKSQGKFSVVIDALILTTFSPGYVSIQ